MMSDRDKEPNQAGEIEAKLIRYLDKTGYPIELRVGGIFEKYGWRVNHNSYYVDEDEQKGREIDIVAVSNTSSTQYRIAVCSSLICGIKKGTKYPWVIFSTKRGTAEHEGWGRLHYAEGQVDSTLLPFEQIERKSTTSQFARIGRSYCEAYKSDDAKSAIFEALTAVVKASEYWVKKNKESSSGFYRDSLGSRDITFVDPIIVLDGLLYEAYLDDDNHLQIEEKTHIPVSLGHISKAYGPGYLVEIVALNALDQLISKKREWIESIKESIIAKLSGV